MSSASRFFGGIAVVALLFTGACSGPTEDGPEEPAATSEEAEAVEGDTEATDSEQIELLVTGYTAADEELMSLEVELPDGSHIDLVPSDDVSYYVDGVSITPAEAVDFYQGRENLVYVALDTWESGDPMDVSDGDVYTTAHFTGG